MPVVDKLSTRRIAAFLGVAAAATWALAAVTVAIPSGTAQPCPDAEVVFARGTGEPPGLGGTGQAFVDSLRAQTGGKSVRIYPVSYPASNDFANSIAAGANDASAHVQSTAASCPNTKIVLGGFSQGGAVVSKTTETMPPAVADRVAAVAVFGNPKSAHAAKLAGGPLPAISPLYAPKTIDLCLPEDPICTEATSLWAFFAHDMYAITGTTTEAAKFAAGRL